MQNQQPIEDLKKSQIDNDNSPSTASSAGDTGTEEALKTKSPAKDKIPSPPKVALENQIPGYPNYKIINRQGKAVPYDAERIRVAILKNLMDVNQTTQNADVHVENAQKCTTIVQLQILSKYPNRSVGIEEIQDLVEMTLFRNLSHEEGRAYTLYREEKAKQRGEATPPAVEKTINVRYNRGSTPIPMKFAKADISRILYRAVSECNPLADGVDVKTNHEISEKIAGRVLEDLCQDNDIKSFEDVMILCCREAMENDPIYSKISAAIMRGALYDRIISNLYKSELPAKKKEDILNSIEIRRQSRSYFARYIKTATESGNLDPRMLGFDLDMLGKHIGKHQKERDEKLGFISLQTLADRYLIRNDDLIIESPQALFMRVAMGLSLKEKDKNQSAIEFYDVLSNLDFMSSTPTLFNAGTINPQLSSCFISTIKDSLKGIFDSAKENALMAKYAGGIGNDWTYVRSLGSEIVGTHGFSQGTIPFLKVFCDIAGAVNQGGKRQGAVCAYMEPWHLDIEAFIELRKNTGDDRRRTPDMNTACWVPDLLMERVIKKENWSLFSPDEVPGLHDAYGRDFEKLYLQYEEMGKEKKLKCYKEMPAIKLWKAILGMLFETGHPWITFKDPCNLRSAQQHAGIVHSSNLCTEITLNNNPETETAVCNLGSVNLANHLTMKGEKLALDRNKLRKTVRIAMRILDNVIDLNMYTTKKTKNANLAHRPTGLGIMGLYDTMAQMRIPMDSKEAVLFNDQMMETISFFAIEASTNLARERGVYSSYKGSLWSQGIMPVDSIDLLREQRENGNLAMDSKSHAGMDWNDLRTKIKDLGMRHSLCTAIAPTATIANICNVSQSIEPPLKMLYVKSNLSGEFTELNQYLVEDLKDLGLWDPAMVADMKHNNGSIQKISRIPDEIKRLYRSATEMDMLSLIDAAAARQKWIDQSQSLNMYIGSTKGKDLSDMYIHAWRAGLKTTYYLRSTGATHVEKSTMRMDQIGASSLRSVSKATRGSANAPDTDTADSGVLRVSETPDIKVGKDLTVLDETKSCEVCQ